MGNSCDAMDMQLSETLQKLSKSEVMNKTDIEIILNGIKSSNMNVVFDCIKAIRRMLSVSSLPDNNLIETIVAHDVIPICVSILDALDHSELLYETTWLLLNISTGNEDQTRSITEAGGVPKLINLLTYKSQNVIEVAAWTLSNIACDGLKQRDLLMANKIIDKIVRILNDPASTDQTLKVMTWLCTNLCYPISYYSPRYSHVKALVQPLINLLDRENVRIVKASAQTLRHIFRNVQAITDSMNTNLLEKLQKMLESPVSTIVYQGILIFGAISCGNKNEIDRMLENHEFAETFLKILISDSVENVKEVSWALFKLLSRASSFTVKNFVDNLNIFDIMRDLMKWNYLPLNNVVNLIINLLRDHSGATYLDIEE